MSFKNNRRSSAPFLRAEALLQEILLNLSKVGWVLRVGSKDVPKLDSENKGQWQEGRENWQGTQSPAPLY